MTYLQRLLVALGIILMVPACTGKADLPPPAVPVVLPSPVPCIPEQVPQPDLPTATADMGIFDLAKVALARAEVLEGDAERLRAANKNPCPEIEQ